MARAQHRSRGGTRQNYVTPEKFIASVKRLLGIAEFTHDYGADATNTKAKTFYSAEDSAFDHPIDEWVARSRDGWGWLNPEFRLIPRYVRALLPAMHEGANVAALVPAGVGSNWFRDFAHGKVRVVFLNGRITFDVAPPAGWSGPEPWTGNINPKTGKADPYPKDLMLLLYSLRVDPGYEVWTWDDTKTSKR